MPIKRLSISIPLELAKFLENNPELKPSAMFQQKIKSVMEQRKDFEHLIKIKDNIIRNLMNFITEKKLNNEFSEWKNK